MLTFHRVIQGVSKISFILLKKRQINEDLPFFFFLLIIKSNRYQKEIQWLLRVGVYSLPSASPASASFSFPGSNFTGNKRAAVLHLSKYFNLEISGRIQPTAPDCIGDINIPDVSAEVVKFY